jgi:hypothetical protein
MTWTDILATALVGTERRGSDVEGPGLLDEAAAWAVYRRAGQPPVPDLPAPVLAPPEDRETVVPVASARLAALLEPASMMDSMTRAALIPEWLRAAAGAGRLVAPELLPDLLDAGRRDVSLRPLIRAAGGARAGWLAGMRPEWSYLTSEVDESPADPVLAWDEGTAGQRAGYLAAYRRRAPHGARELLAADWASLAPDERQRLLTTFHIGLSDQDEPFLEAALDDRRREVRAVAVDLLAALPGSAYNARALARARAALTLTGTAVEVAPPAECDRAMRRDGLDHRPVDGLGARAWWLEQVLARAPLAELIPLPPAAFLELSIVDDWAPVVLGGLAQAAAARRDPAWAAALLDRVEARLRQEGRRWFAVLEGLYLALPTEELVGRIAGALVSTDPDASRSVEWLLQQLSAPWPDALGPPVLDWLNRAARSTVRWPSLEAIGRLAALGLPVAYAEPAERLAEALRSEEPDNPRRPVLGRLASTLRLRHQMIEELA